MVNKNNNGKGGLFSRLDIVAIIGVFILFIIVFIYGSVPLALILSMAIAGPLCVRLYRRKHYILTPDNDTTVKPDITYDDEKVNKLGYSTSARRKIYLSKPEMLHDPQNIKFCSRCERPFYYKKHTLCPYCTQYDPNMEGNIILLPFSKQLVGATDLKSGQRTYINADGDTLVGPAPLPVDVFVFPTSVDKIKEWFFSAQGMYGRRNSLFLFSQNEIFSRDCQDDMILVADMVTTNLIKLYDKNYKIDEETTGKWWKKLKSVHPKHIDTRYNNKEDFLKRITKILAVPDEKYSIYIQLPNPVKRSAFTYRPTIEPTLLYTQLFFFFRTGYVVMQELVNKNYGTYEEIWQQVYSPTPYPPPN